MTSSATFDPNKFRVEELFRAKEEHRQRLAKLPFEEKIKIVEKLQRGVAAAMKNEKLIFDSFLKVCPDFAGEPIAEWDVVEDWYGKRRLEPPPHPFDKRPDIIALTASGKRIGVELKSWVNREQIAKARKQERIQDNILKAIGQQPPNETEWIGYVWLSAKQMRFDSADAADFRRQMFGLLEQVDTCWSQKPEWEQEWADDITDFTGFRLVEKYLNKIQVHPISEDRFKDHWIQFPSPGGFDSPNEMLETLSASVLAYRNNEKYKSLKTQVGLDEVYLLVHYDFNAFAFNTPFDAPNFGFKEAAQFASKVLDADGGYFDRVFLFRFLWGKEKACRVFPTAVSQR